MTQPLLKLEQLEVVYHRVITAVQGISLAVPAGSIVALLGTNGAGVYHAARDFRIISLDDARVTAGSIEYRGERIENQPPHRITARGITLVPERSKVFENLTVAENIEAAVPRPGADARKLTDAVWEYFPALARLRSREAGYLSGGERQMLAIGSALACAPELLLVDELSQGIAPRIVDDLLFRLQAIRKDLGMTLLLVEQNAAVALDVADYAYVLENGRIVLDGTPEKLRQHRTPRVLSGYRGSQRRAAAIAT